MGLKHFTLLRVAQAGVIRYVKGPKRGFPIGYHFLREDVMKIKHAFENYAVPAQGYSKAGELITLRDAVKNYLGRDSGLPAAIQAVMDGMLVPVGHTMRSPGIREYLFLSEDLRRYRPMPGVEKLPEGFLNFREAASMLGIRSNVVRGLVAQGLLTVAAGYRNGFSKLVPANEVQRFAERYVAASVLAKRFNLNGWSFARYLRQSGTPLLVVAIPDEGKGDALFLRKDSAALLRIPPNTLAEGVDGGVTLRSSPCPVCGQVPRWRRNIYCART